MTVADLALFVAAAAGFVLPFAAGWRELRHPRDAKPLDIDLQFARDDRYFARSFQRRLAVAMAAQAGTEPVEGLRRPDRVLTMLGDFRVNWVGAPDAVVRVGGNLSAQADAVIPKEILVGGSVTLSERVRLRALKADGNVLLGAGTRVARWIDAGGAIEAGAGCDLGARATSASAIRLRSGCAFRLLAAPEITVVSAGEVPAAAALRAVKPVPVAAVVASVPHRVRADGVPLVDGDLNLPGDTQAVGDLVATGSVCIGSGAILHGSLHADGDVVLEPGAVVDGSVIARRVLRLSAGARVGAHAVAGQQAVLEPGAVVGTPGRTTSLLARSRIELSSRCVVYGRVVTSGEGVVR